MFSTPSPAEIIEQLRFGILSSLCSVHMDRFGRRTYHYCAKRSSRQDQAHFFSDDVRHSLFADADIHGLDDFLGEDMTPFMTPVISNRIRRPSMKPRLTARPSFQCFASINNTNFNGLDYEDGDSMDSMDITSPNKTNLQISQEWDLKHLRIGSCRNTVSNKLASVNEYLMAETPPLPVIMSGDCMDFDIENDKMQLDILDVLEIVEEMDEVSPNTQLSEITPSSMTNVSDSSQASLGSDRSRKILHRKSDGSLLNLLSFKFLTKHINPVCQ